MDNKKVINKKHKRVMISLPNGLYNEIINFCNDNNMYVSSFCSNVIKDSLKNVNLNYLVLD